MAIKSTEFYLWYAIFNVRKKCTYENTYKMHICTKEIQEEYTWN